MWGLETFQTYFDQAGDIIGSASEFVGDVDDVINPKGTGPTPSPSAPAPAPVSESETYTETDGQGVLDRLAGTLGLPPAAVKWTVYGLVAVVVAAIVAKLVFKGRK